MLEEGVMVHMVNLKVPLTCRRESLIMIQGEGGREGEDWGGFQPGH
jgi:hypothetical protein